MIIFGILLEYSLVKDVYFIYGKINIIILKEN